MNALDAFGETSQPRGEEVFAGFTIKHRPAPVPKRILAYITDLGIVSTIIYALFFVLMPIFGLGAFAFMPVLKDSPSASWMVTILMTIVILGVFMGLYHGYFIYFEYKQGTTPGKRLFGLSVISADGKGLSLGQCILRDMMRWVDCMLVLPGLISVTMSEKKRRLGDMMASTLVVHSPTEEAEHEFLYLPQSHYHYWGSRLGAQPVPKKEAQSYLASAYAVYILQKQPASALQSWRGFIEKFVTEIPPELDGTTLELFFAEHCNQLLNKRS